MSVPGQPVPAQASESFGRALRALRLESRRHALSHPALGAAIVFIAFVSRVALLGEDSLWFDTAHSAVVASNTTIGEVLGAAAADFQSPLYFVLLHLWLAVSTDDFWLALPSAFLGTATVALTYTTARRWFSPGAGLIGAMFAALTSYQVFYSRYPRGYMLLAFLALLAAYSLQRALADGGARRWAAHGVAVLAALYTHPYGFFLLPILWGYATVFVSLRGIRQGAGLRTLMGSLIPLGLTSSLVGAGYLPWLGVTASQWGGVRAGADSWIEPVSRDSFKVLWDWLWFKTRLEYTPVVDLALRAARYGLTALMLVALWRGRRHPELWLTAGLVGGPVALLYGLSVLAVPLWDPRYLVILSPFFALWLAYAVPGRLRGTSAAVIALMSIPPLASLYFDPALRSPDIEGAARWVREGHRSRELILHINYQSYLPTLWYDHQARSQDPAGPYAVPCVWEAMPDSWCEASPYRQGYVNLERDEFGRAVSGEQRFWLMAVYNHNRTGEAEAVRERVAALTTPRFRRVREAERIGVLVYQFELNGSSPNGTLLP